MTLHWLPKLWSFFYLLYIHDHVPFFFTFCVNDALLFDTVSWADDSRANLSCKSHQIELH
jgi:hypothetical protein